jgi:ribosomal-protein-alanine N-acetyltransferase
MEHYFQPLVTSRLILRCLEPGDAADISRLITPNVARWVASWAFPFTVEMAEERIRGNRARAREGKAVPCAVIREADGQFMGYIGIFATEPGRAALGYWLGDAFHGQGYMREAAPMALRAGFEILGVRTIEAGAQLANAASFAVMKACGMRFVGERMTFAASRQIEELCAYYEATAP